MVAHMETYTAFGESYTLTRTNGGWWRVTHAATGEAAHPFGTRGYATHYARTDAQRRALAAV